MIIKVDQRRYGKKQKDREIKGQNRKDQNWWAEYNKYMKSKAWATKRGLVLQRDNHTCQSCLKNVATQVHHLSYRFVDFLGNEPAFDLMSVCKECHDAIEVVKKTKLYFRDAER